jgi:hypothetical protein
VMPALELLFEKVWNMFSAIDRLPFLEIRQIAGQPRAHGQYITAYGSTIAYLNFVLNRRRTDGRTRANCASGKRGGSEHVGAQ